MKQKAEEKQRQLRWDVLTSGGRRDQSAGTRVYVLGRQGGFDLTRTA